MNPSTPAPYLTQAELDWIAKEQASDKEWRKQFLGDWSFLEICPKCRMANEECKCQKTR